MLDGFYVLTMISNPMRYQRRYDLYNRFVGHMARAGVKLMTCEVAYGGMPFAVTDAANPLHLQLRTDEILWHKENALALLAHRLPADARYIAWIDADVEFFNSNGDHAWPLETVRGLQQYDIVQLFTTAIDLGPNFEAIQTHTGFGFSYVTGREREPNYMRGHPGFAWAMRRDAWERVNLSGVDFAILGSGDYHFCTAAIGEVATSYPRQVTTAYADRLKAFENAAVKALRKNLGFVPGTILHLWHGKKSDRRYVSRWDIITKNKFDPNYDLTRDGSGLLQLVDHGDDRSVKLRQEIESYFRQRNEDSVDLV